MLLLQCAINSPKKTGFEVSAAAKLLISAKIMGSCDSKIWKSCRSWAFLHVCSRSHDGCRSRVGLLFFSLDEVSESSDFKFSSDVSDIDRDHSLFHYDVLLVGHGVLGGGGSVALPGGWGYEPVEEEEAALAFVDEEEQVVVIVAPLDCGHGRWTGWQSAWERSSKGLRTWCRCCCWWA